MIISSIIPSTVRAPLNPLLRGAGTVLWGGGSFLSKTYKREAGGWLFRGKGLFKGLSKTLRKAKRAIVIYDLNLRPY